MENLTYILGVKIDLRSEEEILRVISTYLDDEEKKHMIFTPNPEFLVEAERNSDFLVTLNKSDINLPDGIGLLFASKLLSLKTRFKNTKKLKVIFALWQTFYTLLSLLVYPNFCRKIIKERISGSDFFWELIELAKNQKKRVFLLGAMPGVADMVREKILDLYPNMQISGTYAGSPDQSSEDHICHIINKSESDILMVAYGAPAQEKWIVRNLNKLNTVKVAIGVGGTFDFVAGKVKRAPQIMRKLGLEWLYRLLLTPSRLKRIYNATIKFTSLVVKEKLS